MHRAAWLARHVCKPEQKVLFTTFTRNLATDISTHLKKICSREEWERIEVINLDAWVRRFLEKQQFHLRLTFEDASSEDLWTKAIQLAGEVPFPANFIRDEWDNVIQGQGIESWEAYMTVSRVGRNRRLNRQERLQLWPIFQEYRAMLTERGLCEPPDAFRAASRLIRQRNVAFPYRSVIVDEAQDFGNEAFRLIRTLVPTGENDLFIVGDAHQRIYGHQVVLSRCGIDIRGRGRKLRINYRTTEELKNWATGLLKGLSFDDLDAGTDEADGVRSLVHGEPPVIKTCSSQAAAAKEACAHIKALIGNGASPEGICFVARTHRELQSYENHLKQVCTKLHEIKRSEADDSSKPGLRLATIHRVKGLEFDHVVIADKLKNLEPSATPRDSAHQERALLYVAATRARHSLLVCRVKAD
jgi:superfamily I DNA/RNA helicase